MKQYLNRKTLMTTKLALLSSLLALSLNGCAKENRESLDYLESEEKLEELVATPIDKPKETTIPKDTLKLALLWNQKGTLEYRVIKFDDEINGEFINTNLQVETRTFTSLSHEHETRTIIDYNYYVEDKENKYLYRNCSNALYLDNIYTIPDYNLQGYYGIMDLNTLDLPGRFKIQTEYSLEDIKELERLLNEGLLDLNQPEEQYNINDLPNI